MALPVIAAYAVGAAGVGYLGAKIDDLAEWWNGEKTSPKTTDESVFDTLGVSPVQVFVFAAMGLALVWGARKAGVLK